MAKNCTKTVSSSLIKVEEHRRKAVFRNPKRDPYEVSLIDGCLIDDGVRADFLVSEVGKASVIVELKGSNVAHACEQVIASASHEAIKPLLHGKIGFLIISSRFPRFDTYVAKAKQRCARELKAGFHVVCSQGEFDIARVVAINGPY
jgi:hypothetical protein